MAQEVVLGRSLAAARRPGLDLARAQADREVGNVVVLSLTRPEHKHGPVEWAENNKKACRVRVVLRASGWIGGEGSIDCDGWVVGWIGLMLRNSPVRSHHTPAVLLGELHGSDGLAHGADLVHLPKPLHGER